MASIPRLPIATLAKQAHCQTQLERAVIVAIRWMGRGAVSDDAPEKVLNLSVSLERLLTTDSEAHSDIADRLAKRLAFLLSDKSEERMAISKRMKKLYGLRSEVSHAGRTEIPSHDLIELERFACWAIIRMAQRLTDWTGHSEFVQWAEEQIYK